MTSSQNTKGKEAKSGNDLVKKNLLSKIPPSEPRTANKKKKKKAGHREIHCKRQAPKVCLTRIWTLRILKQCRMRWKYAEGKIVPFLRKSNRDSNKCTIKQSTLTRLLRYFGMTVQWPTQTIRSKSSEESVSILNSRSATMRSFILHVKVHRFASPIPVPQSYSFTWHHEIFGTKKVEPGIYAFSD